MSKFNGLVEGKILTGNHLDFPIMGQNPVTFHLNQSIEKYEKRNIIIFLRRLDVGFDVFVFGNLMDQN